MADIGIKISAIDDTKGAFDSVGRGLASVKSGAAAADNAVSKMGMSAAQTAAAMRNVPAQFTDIVVSLQSGQKPLTVLLQQGGQLKDMFGGVGNAARAMGTYVAGLDLPLTITAGAIAAVGMAYYKGSQESDAYNKALILTGNAAGTTSGKMADMAANMAHLGTTQGAAAQALAAFAGTGQFAAASLEKFSLAAVKYASATGAAIDDTVKQFSELGKSPLDASINLNGSINHLTLSLYEQIKALDEQGKHTEAANLAQNAFADTITSRSAEMVSKLGLVERAWAAIKKAASEAVDAGAGIGRETGLGEQIKSQQLRVTNAQNNVDYEQRSHYGGPVGLRESQSVLDTERAKLEVLRETERLASRAATARGQETSAVRAQIEFDKQAEKYKTNAVKLQEELTRLAQQYAAVTHDGTLGEKNAAAYATSIEKIKDQYKDKVEPKKPVDLGTYDALIKSIREKIAVQEQELTGVEKLTKGEQDQAKFLADLRDGTAGLVVVHGKTVQAQAQEIVQLYQLQIGREKENALMLEAAAMREDAAKAYDAYNKKSVQEVDAINAKAQAVEDEVAAYGLTKDALRQLTITRLEDQAAQITRFEPSDVAQQEVAAIEARIAAIRRLGNAETALEQKDAVSKAAKHAEQQWQKAADEINRAVTDSLMRAFENGEGFAQTFAKTVEAMFKTIILRPVVSAVVTPLSSAVSSAIGFSDSPNGAGGLLNSASNLNSLYGNASKLFGGGAASDFGLFTSGGAGWLAGGGAAAGASAALPALTTAAIEAGITAGGASIYSLGTAAGAAGVTIGAAGGGTLAASGVLASGSTVAATGLGAGAAGAAAIPGIGWAIGGLALLAGIFGGGGGHYVQSTGDAMRTYNPDGSLKSNDTNGQRWFTNTDRSIGVVDGLQAQYQKSAKQLGIGTVQTNFQYGSNDSDGGKFSLYGAAGKYSANQGETPTTDAGLKLAASRAVFAALQGSDLPKYLAGIFDNLTAGTLSQDQVDAALQTAQAFTNLSKSLADLPFDSLKDQTYAVYKAVTDAAGGLEKFGQSLGTYYTNFYSAEEQRAQTAKNLSRVLGDVGLSLPATRDAFRSLVDAQDLTTEAGQKAYSALIGVSGAFAGITTAATDAATALKQQAEAAKAAIEAAASARSALLGNATTGAQSALDALSRSVAAQQAKDVAANEAQRAIATAAFTSQNELYQQQIDSTRKSLDAVGQSVGKLQSFSGSLKSTLDDLRIAGSDGDYRTRAQAQISAALSTARAGGGLPLDGQLASALSTVSKPSEQLFGSFVDYARDFYKTANDIAALGDLTDLQLSADQVTQGILTKQVNALSDQKLALKEGFADQLSSLDAILTNAQLQLDAANGINTSVLSVADALTAFASAIAGLESTRAGQGLATSTSTAATTAATARKDAIQQYMQGLADNTNLSDYDKAQTLYAQARLVGVSEAEIAKTVGVSAVDARRWFSNFGVPQFAVGTNYVPHDMLAKIHEGEAIIPKAYNPAANGQGGNARLEALVEKLTAEVAELRAAQERGNVHTDRTARILDGQQGVPLLVEIAA